MSRLTGHSRAWLALMIALSIAAAARGQVVTDTMSRLYTVGAGSGSGVTDVVSRLYTVGAGSGSGVTDVVSRLYTVGAGSGSGVTDVVSRLYTVGAGSGSGVTDVVSRLYTVGTGAVGVAGVTDITSRLYTVGVLMPDLRVIAVVPEAEAIGTDEPLGVTWFTRNAGAGAAQGSWTDQVFWSPSADGSSAMLAASHVVTGPLAPGENTTVSLVLTAPSSPGEWWLVAKTDVLGNVDEAGPLPAESNNTLVSDSPVLVAQAARADLVVMSLTPPSSAPPGAVVEIAWLTGNQGTADAIAPWTEEVLLSSDDQPGGDTLLLSESVSDSIAVGGVLARSAIVTMPAVVPDPAWIVVRTNAGSEIIELPGDNNFAVSPICTTCELPDVIGSSLLAPTSVTAGEVIALSWAITNSGTGAAPAGWRDEVRLVPESGGAAVVVGSVEHPSDLPQGAVLPQEIALEVPLDLSGAYRAQIALDADNDLYEPGGETNNLLVSAQITAVVQPPLPDLVASIIEAPKEGEAGAIAEVSWTVTNIGTLEAGAPWADRLYLSADANFDPGVDELRATWTSTAPLAPGASYAQPVVRAVVLPPSPGTWWFIVVTDGFDDVEEGAAEGNNTLVHAQPITVQWPPRPNLRATIVSEPPPSPAGALVSVSWSVTNDGDVGLNTGEDPDYDGVSWNERIYASSDSAVGGDVLLATVVRSDAIALGAVVERALDVPVPSMPGGYRLVVHVDSSAALVETNESDNFLIAEAPSTVLLPNLACSAVTHPSTGVADGQALVEWTVTNTSNAVATSASWTDIVFVQPSGGGAPQAVGSVTHAQVLAPGASVLSSVSAVLPGYALGEYLVSVAVDVDGAITESTEADNAGQGGSLTITQPPRADLIVESIDIPVDDFVGRPFTASWTIRNEGEAPVAAPFTDRVLARDVKSGTEYILGSAIVSQAIDPAASLAVTASCAMPSLPGVYELVVVTDRTNQVNEGPSGGEDDNRSVSEATFLAESYIVLAQTIVESQPTPALVPLTGHAQTAVTGKPVPGMPVSVAVDVQGTRRTLAATTDPAGDFEVNFTPLSTESGQYALRAGPPGLIAPDATDAFDLFGLRADPAQRAVEVHPGLRPAVTAFTIRNNGDTTISGVTVTPGAAPQGISVEIALSSTDLPPLGSLSAIVTVSAESSASHGSSTVPLSIFCAQGAAAAAGLSLTVQPPDSLLTSTPQSLVSGVGLPAPGESAVPTLVTFELRNIGAGVTDELTVLLPVADWMSLATPMPLAPLGPGAATTVTLVLTPTESDLAPGATATGTLAVTGASQTLILDFAFTGAIDGEGELRVRATDEGTYWGADGQPIVNGPGVAGAVVTVREHYSQAIVDQQVAGATGEVDFGAVPAGYYDIESAAGDHATHRVTRFVAPGALEDYEAFMPFQGVTYTWTVTPTEIEDEYLISIVATFETYVPAPVVSIEPQFVDLGELAEAQGGGPLQIDYEITNHGLIAAKNATFSAPSVPGWIVTPLVTDLGDLAANSTVVVPVMAVPEGQPGGECAPGHPAVCWELTCGQTYEYCSQAVMVGPGDCPPPPPGAPIQAEPGPEAGGGGMVIIPQPPPVTLPMPCLPCLSDCAEAIIGCVLTNPCHAAAYNCGRALICAFTDQCNVTVSRVGNCVLSGVACAGQALPEWLYPLVDYECLCNLISGCILACADAQILGCSVPDMVFGYIDKALGLEEGAESPVPPFLPRTGNPIHDYAIRQLELAVAVQAVLWYPFGTEQWLLIAPEESEIFDLWRSELVLYTADESEGGSRLTSSEMLSLHTLVHPSNLAPSDLDAFFQRWNRTVDYWDAGVRTAEMVPPGLSLDFIDQNVLAALWNFGWEAIEEVEAAGHEGIVEALQHARDLIAADFNQSQQGICATVSVQLDQTVAVTRGAFDAHLTIDNASSAPLEALAAEIEVRTLSGEDATHLFAVEIESLSGVSAIDGSEALPGLSSALVHWRLIPSDDAAPSAPVHYLVSGDFSYVHEGQLAQEALYPIEIEVHPNADLKFRYFLERFVYADDPFTAEVEPSVPFSLGLLVVNEGAGEAGNVTVASAQPQIVENDQGLLVDFQIIAAQAGDQPLEPSLTVPLGDFPPGMAQSARWLMTSSLQGEFTAMSATVENLSGLGDPQFWVIDPQVDVRWMAHAVRADVPGDDGALDFLADAVPEATEIIPEILWQSTGASAPVNAVLTAAVQPQPGEVLTALALAVVDPAGWNYLRFTDPFGGQYQLTGVSRSDGRVIMVGPNAWQTDRIIQHGPSIPAPRIHLLDFGGTGQYTLTFDADVTPPVVTGWASIAAYGDAGRYPIPIPTGALFTEPRVGGPETIRILFSEVIDSASFIPANLHLRGLASGGAVDEHIPASVVLTGGGMVGEITFTEPLPDLVGYCLELERVRDLAGNALSGDASIEFITVVGDVRNDGRVWFEDITTLLNLIGTSPIDPGDIDHLRADLNRDNAIDSADLAILEQAWENSGRALRTPCSRRAPTGTSAEPPPSTGGTGAVK